MKDMRRPHIEKVDVQTINVAQSLESVFGCKWSLQILGLIRGGICRPCAINRALENLSVKVQNHYFRRMMSLGILERLVYPEVPPHVEYRLTKFGLKLMPILDSIKALQRDLEADIRVGRLEEMT